jgi:hypothetical protein
MAIKFSRPLRPRLQPTPRQNDGWSKPIISDENIEGSTNSFRMNNFIFFRQKKFDDREINRRIVFDL